MKRVSFLISIALILILASCSKNEENIDNNEPGYIPLHPGNYWVYEQYKIDTLGNETLLNQYDSVVITGSTSVNGKTYFVFEGTWMSGTNLTDTIQMIRDSSGYFVDQFGSILFSSSNFTDTLFTYTGLNNHTGDTVYQSWYKMQSEPQIIAVPSGTYVALNYRGTIYTMNPNPHVPEIRYKDQLYSKNVGQVLDTYYFLGSPDRYERRLKHYIVNQPSN